VAVVVFDADVLIGYRNRDDPLHEQAFERVRQALEPGTRRLISAVNSTELLIGPLRASGREGADAVDEMLVRLAIETIQVDMALAQRAAAIRARTNVKLPDAYAIATAIHAEKRGHGDVRLESFDERVVSAYAALHGS
jgi:predicted nucleic acid-binding protein